MTTFQSALSLQTIRPSSRSAVVAQQQQIAPSQLDVKNHRNTTPTTGTISSLVNTNLNEARYWERAFGLGSRSTDGFSQVPPTSSGQHRSRSLETSDRCAIVTAGTSSVVHDLQFWGDDGNNNNSKNRVCPLVVACGPRLSLFGTSTLSDFHKTLAHKASTSKPSSSSSLSVPTQVLVADRQITTRGQLALCCDVRADDRLIAIGTASGQVLICDLISRATLVTFSLVARTSTSDNSDLPIRTVRWFRNGQMLLSAGDDGRLHIWSMTQSQQQQQQEQHMPLWTGIGHGDAIRCAGLWQVPAAVMARSSSSHQPWCTAMVATGSYDHTVRLWNLDHLIRADVLQQQQDPAVFDHCHAILVHDAPVEAVVWMSSSPSSPTTTSTTTASTANTPPVWLISASATSLRVWNPVAGTAVCTIPSFHRKTITSLIAMPRVDFLSQDHRVDSTPIKRNNAAAVTATARVTMRLITASLDGWIRIFAWFQQTGQLQHLYGCKIVPSNTTSNNNMSTSDAAATAITALACSRSTYNNNTTSTSIKTNTLYNPQNNKIRLAIGMVDGTVRVYQRRNGFRKQQQQLQHQQRKRNPPAGTYAFFSRGQNVGLPSTALTATTWTGWDGSGSSTTIAMDMIVEDPSGTSNKRNRNNNNNNNTMNFANAAAIDSVVYPVSHKLRKFDVALKQFRYADALDEALETRRPAFVLAVLEELGKRRGLHAALSHRDEESLEPILAFIVRYICNSSSSSSSTAGMGGGSAGSITATRQASALLLGVAHAILDIYGHVIGQSETIDELFAKLRITVSAECRSQRTLQRLVGQMDSILAAEALQQQHVDNDDSEQVADDIVE